LASIRIRIRIHKVVESGSNADPENIGADRIGIWIRKLEMFSSFSSGIGSVIKQSVPEDMDVDDDLDDPNEVIFYVEYAGCLSQVVKFCKPKHQIPGAAISVLHQGQVFGKVKFLDGFSLWQLIITVIASWKRNTETYGTCFFTNLTAIFLLNFLFKCFLLCQVYAISTVVNLADKSKDAVNGLRRFLLEQTAKGNDRYPLPINELSLFLSVQIQFVVF
jgi:hypothetical protein